MGLDMYLDKVKKVKGLELGEILELYREYDNSNEDQKINSKFDVIRPILVRRGDDSFNWVSIFDEVIYWRKANAIHGWFVDNIQGGEDNCDYYEVTKDQVIALRDLCKQVLETMVLVNGQVADYYTYNDFGKEVPHLVPSLEIVNKAEIDKLLPARGGFFFGNTEYNDYYRQDIEYTYEELCKVIDNFNFDEYYLLYNSSW